MDKRQKLLLSVCAFVGGQGARRLQCFFRIAFVCVVESFLIGEVRAHSWDISTQGFQLYESIERQMRIGPIRLSGIRACARMHYSEH